MTDQVHRTSVRRVALHIARVAGSQTLIVTWRRIVSTKSKAFIYSNLAKEPTLHDHEP